MADDELEHRRKMDFLQAEGLAPLPRRLRLKEVSPELRARLWAVVFKDVQRSTYSDAPWAVCDPWAQISFDFYVHILHRAADEWSDRIDDTVSVLKANLLSSNYGLVLNAIQFIVRHPMCGRGLKEGIAQELERCQASYYLDLSGHPTIMPAASPEEARAIQEAFANLHGREHGGAREHLRRAGEELNAGNFAASVRESITAVESVAKVISGKDKATLDDAVKALAAKHDIHPALKKAVGALYGYTSDEQGIRHALTDQPTKVTVAEAQFMLGACASFISYLLEKS